MAAEIRRADVAPVREALVDTVHGILQTAQFRIDQAAAQSDVLRAVADYLRALATERGFSKQKSEGDEVLRDRLLEALKVTTPEAIIAVVNAILAPFTSTECILLDSVLDRWYINNGTDGKGGDSRWHSHIGNTPSYPKRFYENDSIANGGYFRPNSDPGGIRIFDNSIGRQFVLLLPNLVGQEDSISFVQPEDKETYEVFAGDLGAWSVNQAEAPASGFQDPTGGNNAFELIEDASAGSQHFYNRITSLSGSERFELSGWFRPQSRNVALHNQGFGVRGASFDLQNGIVLSANQVEVASIQPEASGWRCKIVSTRSSNNWYIHLLDGSDDTYDGNGVLGVKAYDVKLTYRRLIAEPPQELGLGFFIGDGTAGDVAGYIYPAEATEGALYLAIVRAVEPLVGQSIRWGFIGELTP